MTPDVELSNQQKFETEKENSEEWLSIPRCFQLPINDASDDSRDLCRGPNDGRDPFDDHRFPNNR